MLPDCMKAHVILLSSPLSFLCVILEPLYCTACVLWYAWFDKQGLQCVALSASISGATLSPSRHVGEKLQICCVAGEISG
jgi:hypothetical protein